MKRTCICIALACCAIALVAAHDNNRRLDRYHGGPHSRNFSHGMPRNVPPKPEPIQRPAPESAVVSGNLTLVRGMIALNSGGVTYVAGGLNRFIGFIDGLKEGASVTLEGSAFSVPREDSVKFLHVQKMTLNGKDYDIAPPRQNPNPGPMPPPPPQPRRGR